MDRTDYSLLKCYIKNTDWCNCHSNILIVGRILKNEHVLDTVDITFDYFDRPWHFEPEMKTLIMEYELDLVSNDFFSIIPDERDVALQWLVELNLISEEAYSLLWDDIEDKL